MSVRPVLLYPHPLLKKVASPCGLDTFLLDDLVDTMRAHPRCTGLAANQIGVARRAIVVDVTGHKKTTTCHGLIALCDPVVVASHGSELGREGCLSLPDITADVRRAAELTVWGLSPEGERAIVTRGFEARALLHELDHLDGILILDRAASPSEVFARKRRS